VGVEESQTMKVDKLVSEETSGSIAKEFVSQITRYHRIQASTMYHEAAEYVRSEFVKMGLGDAKIERFTADGKHTYWTYTSPVGWEARSAELSLVEPESRLLASYQDCPQSLHTFSKGTSKQGVTAELVDVGPGSEEKDYKGKNVKGKFVLATGRASVIHDEAVYRRGAAGVITDSMPYEFPNVRESIDVPDAHAYQGIWPSAKDLGKLTFGFSLSKRQGNQLRKQLKSGKKVVLKAVVDARLFPGHEEVVTATIRGTEKPAEEVFIIAHLCHPKPGANDNASGSGAVLEVARTITNLMKSGKIERPKRTIRFLLVPETLGTVAYLAEHDDIPRRFLAGINLDMVGEDQEKCGSVLGMTRTPNSLPSFLNDFMVDVFERSSKSIDEMVAAGLPPKFRFMPSRFSAGSDHAEFTTSTTKVPCVSFTQWPDKFYHTSMDTIDNVSESSMKRVSWVAAVGALDLSNADSKEVLRMVYLVSAKGAQRLKEAGAEISRELFEAAEKLRGKKSEQAEEMLRVASFGRTKLADIASSELASLESAERFGKSKATSSLVRRCQREIEAIATQETSKLAEVLATLTTIERITLPKDLPETKQIAELRRITPRKMFKGTLCGDLVKEKLGHEGYAKFKSIGEKDSEFDNKAVETLNFMNGERSGLDILYAVSSEYGQTDPEMLLHFIKELEKIGLVKFA
jgi:hypothetical protein